MATKRAAPRAKKADPPKLTVLQIGNFGTPHSTESHLLRALQGNGHNVNSAQENGRRMWDGLCDIYPGEIDLVLWTRTGWDYTNPDHGDYSSQAEALALQSKFLAKMKEAGVPTVAYHLDLFHGLNPEREAIVSEPFFDCDLAITADGGSDEWFAGHGVNHVWFPPGVSEGETAPGTRQAHMASEIAFVGSWQGHYHRESYHRFQLVRWLQDNFPGRCRFWPNPGQPAIRGARLRDLYASVDVVVGDSCLVGTGHKNYWSDRIPETLGRGGFLLHPQVEGMEDHFAPAADLHTWEAGDWDGLGVLIEDALGDPSMRRAVAEHGRQTVLEKHTYEFRMAQLVALLQERGMLRCV